MAEVTWEKSSQSIDDLKSTRSALDRYKFFAAGILLLGAVAYLILSGTAMGAQYFVTVEDILHGEESYVGKNVRISGAVIGETIQYDKENLILDFTIAHIPQKMDDLAYTLYVAANSPDTTRLSVHLENEVMPDLLQHEAQAILTGKLGEDGVFYASELLLKCPSRYEENVPEQSSEV